MLCDSIPRDKVQSADALLAEFGFTLRLQNWIDQIDFDPDRTVDQVSSLLNAHDALAAARPPPCAEMFAGADWVGEAHDVACSDVECQRGVWDQILDTLLWLAEQLVQILDYVVDVLRIVVAWITWLAVALSLLALAIVVAATVLSFGPGIITAVVEGPAFAMLGAISLIGTAVSLLLVALNALFEWLETIIRDARTKICGQGLPSLPDWDPAGGYPPLWPS